MQNSLAIIGAGRVGRALGRRVRELGWKIGAVVTRSDASARKAVRFIGARADGHVLGAEDGADPLLVSLGMKRGDAVRALLPLSRQVLENFERLGPRAAWTGPLSRGDYKVVRAHSNALRELPGEFMDAYEALNRLAARVLSQGSAGMLAELEKNSVDQKPKAKVIG